jgi:capsid protein
VTEYAANPQKFEHARFKTRGWSWVDPAKEVAAYKEAVRSGFTTVTDTISQTAGGLDIEDIIETRQRELEMMKAAGITTDTDPGVVAKAQQPAAASGNQEGENAEPDETDDDADRGMRVVSLNRR